MKLFKYVGKVRTAAARMLILPGMSVYLPEHDEHVQSLIAQKLLVEADFNEQPPAKKKKASKKAASKGDKEEVEAEAESEEADEGSDEEGPGEAAE